MNPVQDPRREKVDTLLAEYKTLREEILMRIGAQYKLLQYAFTLLGVVVTLVIALLRFSWESSITKGALLLIIALPFFFFSWSYSNEDIYIARLGRYINTILQPKLQNIIGSKDMLQWEVFLAQLRRPHKLGWWVLTQGMLTLGAEVILLIPLLAMILYFSLPIQSNYEKPYIEKYLIWVDCIMFAISAFMRWLAFKEYGKVNPA